MPLKEKLPNQLFNLAFVTIEEVLGKNGLNSVLNYAKIPHYINNYPPNTLDLEHPSSDFTRFTSGLIEVLGEKGARSVMMLSGIRSFEIMLRDMPGLFALDGIEVKGGPADSSSLMSTCGYKTRCPRRRPMSLETVSTKSPAPRTRGLWRSPPVTGAWESRRRRRSVTAR